MHSIKEELMFRRIAVFVYGVVCYMAALATFAYLAAFLENFAVPRSIDSAPQSPLWIALLVDLCLLVLFGVQHSVMARPTFKAMWTKVVPQAAERSTYVLFSSVAMFLLFWQWQPIGGVIWNIENAYGRITLYVLYALGWVTVLVTTFLINHFDLFGLRQVALQLIGRPYTALRFRTPGPYKLVRHPLYVGWLMVFWATPEMTAAHLLFALGLTTYILIAIQYEERDLVKMHREYAEYRRRVPMMVPIGAPSQSPDNKLSKDCA
jgi:protein-S-isoprenylcysteine O-methyltransferase Ste14